MSGGQNDHSMDNQREPRGFPSAVVVDFFIQIFNEQMQLFHSGRVSRWFCLTNRRFHYRNKTPPGQLDSLGLEMT